MKNYFDSGITIMNLALSGDTTAGYAPGNMANLIGEPDSGKTMFALTSAAASYHKFKKKMRILYYDFECALSFDLPNLFGKSFANDIEIAMQGEKTTVEWWQNDIQERIGRAKLPVFAVVDSYDALTTSIEMEAAADPDKAKEGYRQTGAKARASALYLRDVQRAVMDNGGCLLILSHAKVNQGADSFLKPLRRSGGAALEFYSSQHIWLYKSSAENIEYGDRRVRVGGWTVVEIKRNKTTGTARKFSVPIFPAIGVDDTRSMLHFLCDVGMFKWIGRNMQRIDAGTFGTGSTAEICEAIEQDGRRSKLVEIVTGAWHAQEEAVKATIGSGRKPRFA